MPVNMGVMMLYTCTNGYLTEGPLEPRNIEDSENCKETWYLNLLMVGNLFQKDKKVRTSPERMK